MASRFAFAPFALALVAGCAFDPSQYKASGSGGAGGAISTTAQTSSGVTSNADAATTTASTTTTAVTTTDTSATTTTAATASSTTTSSTTAASTTSASTTTTAASTSTGGTTYLPFCPTGSAAVHDNFNMPMFDSAVWNATNASDDGMRAVLSMPGSNDATLFLQDTTSFASPCAVTVVLVSQNGGEQRFRLNTSGGTWQRVKYYVNGSGARVLSFDQGDSLPVTFPVTIAFATDGSTIKAAYKDGPLGWVQLGGSATVDSSHTDLYVGMTQEAGNNTSSHWDDFNETQVTPADVGF